MSTLADLPSRLLHDPANKARIDAATRAPFLHRAGFEYGFVNARTLCAWLVQDLRYTQAYIRFVAGLLSCIVLPGSESEPQPNAASSSATDTAETSASSSKDRALKELADTLQRVIDLLLSALANVRREQKFFSETVAKYNLSALYDEAEREAVEAGGMNDATRMYAGLFDRFAAGGNMYPETNGEPPRKARKRTATQTASSSSLNHASSVTDSEIAADPSADLETLYHGLLVLWATEWVYYTAWSYVQRLHTTSSSCESWTEAEVHKWHAMRPWTKDGSTLNNANDGAEEALFLPHWTSGDNFNAKKALFQAFIPNWSSEGFKGFVEECEVCLGAVGALLDEVGREERVARVRSRAEGLFGQVLELEKNFWPVVNDRGGRSGDF